MHSATLLFRGRAACAALLAGLFLSSSTFAQTAGAPIPVGSTPAAIAVNPATNKVYVANGGAANLTVIDGKTRTTKTVNLPAAPSHLGINPETNRVYVSIGANVAVVDGSVDAVVATLLTGGAATMTVNPFRNRAYVIRPSTADEVNIVEGDGYVNTLATGSYQPTALAINPVTDRLYVVHQATGDVVALDVAANALYPTRLCPNGSGGFKPFDPADTNPGPCINVPDVPVAIAVNPVTNRVYALSSVSTGQVSVIDGGNHTFVSLSPPGVGNVARAIAVNPLTNRIYAAFATSIVVIDGATNAMTVLPSGSASGGPVAIGINTTTNKIYVPNADGTLKVLNGDDNSSVTLAIPTGARAIAVNPLTNTAYVLGNEVTPIAGSAADTVHATNLSTSISPLPGNTATTASTIALSVANTWSPAALAATRKVYYQFDGVDGPWKVASGTGPYTASLAGLSAGSHTLYAFATNGLDAPSINTHPQHVPIVGTIASYAFTISNTAPVGPRLAFAPASLDFGGQSMNTTSPPQSVTLTNTGDATLAISGIAASSQFGQSGACTSIAPGASCAIAATFTPAIVAGALNSTAAVTGTLTVSSNDPRGSLVVSLAGTAEKSLVTHYYRSILSRAPDSAGKAYWEGEASRMQSLGANVNESWYAMATAFYFSAEYAARSRGATDFVRDLYATFFNRAADDAGLAYWTGLIAQGMPRENVATSFMFSAEFEAFTRAIFGNTAARAEVDVVMDFYRALMARLPDSAGFNYWVGQFRDAQCQGGAAAVMARADSISSAIAQSPEYAARNRSNTLYVADLYNAFMRRGGDIDGIKYWVGQLDSGARTREQVRQQFLASPEFGNRVNAIAAQGCLR